MTSYYSLDVLDTGKKLFEAKEIGRLILSYLGMGEETVDFSIETGVHSQPELGVRTCCTAYNKANPSKRYYEVVDFWTIPMNEGLHGERLEQVQNVSGQFMVSSLDYESSERLEDVVHRLQNKFDAAM